MDCLFCRIIKKEISAEIVYEDENVLSFLDVNPRAPGHTLVLLKAHIETILGLADNLNSPFLRAVKSTIKLLKSALAPDGFTIGINHGKAAGQAIEHLHLHIIPRYKNDGGASLHSIVNNPSEESLQAIKEKIAKTKNI